MRKYRTETSIVLEVLKGIADGEVTAAALSRKVNVPYTRMVELLEEVHRRKLIEPAPTPEKGPDPAPAVYRLTTRGRDFIEDAMRFQRILGIYGLRL